MSWHLFLGICAAALCSGFAHSLPAQPGASPAFHSALLGTNKCTNGPSYWCTNFTTSGQCNADLYCIHNTWSHRVLLADNGEVCNTCQQMVEWAREELGSGKNQVNIKLALKAMCLFRIPTKPVAHECLKQIDQAFPQLIKALPTELSTQVVCAAIGLCNSLRLDKMMAMHKPPTYLSPLKTVNTLQYEQSSSMHKVPLDKNSGHQSVPLVSSVFYTYETLNADNDKNVECDECELCESSLKTLQTDLQNPEIQGVIREVLEEGCLIMPFLVQTQCRLIVEAYSVFAIGIVAQMIHPDQICQMAGLCPSSGANLQYIQNMDETLNAYNGKNVDGELCELCESSLKTLQTDLQKPEIQAVIRKAMENVCLLMPLPVRSQCKLNVDLYLVMFMNIAAQMIKPVPMCQMVGLCASSGANLQYIEVMKANTDHEVTGLICEMCEFMLRTLQSDLMNKNIQSYVSWVVVEQGCHIMPWSVQSQCKQTVEIYSPWVMNLTAQIINPVPMCQMARLCPSTGANLQYIQNIYETLNEYNGKKVDGEVCELCESSLKTLQTDLQNPEMQAVIRKAMENVCLLMPLPVRSQCKLNVDLYLVMFMNIAAQMIEPVPMCRMVGLCASSGANLQYIEVMKANTDHEVTGLICEMCEFMLRTLQSDLMNKNIQPYVSWVVEQGCLIMPGSVQSQCKQTVEIYSPRVMNLTAQIIDPDQMCQMVRLCPSSGANLQYIQIMKANTDHEVTGLICEMCEFMLQTLQSDLMNKNIQSYASWVVEQGCLIMPRSVQSQCKQTVEKYSVWVMNRTAQMIDPVPMCQMVRLCPSTGANLQYIQKNQVLPE